MKHAHKAYRRDLLFRPPLYKRLLDVTLAYLLLIPLYLPMLLIALLIRIDSKGPAIFRQVRIGRCGVPFVCYKFRTMTLQAPHARPTAQFPDAEQYVTRIGRFLRRSSLDELPQLFCVLNGDMSLVGPRPLIAEEEAVHRLRRQNNSDQLRPGITGLAQCHGRDLLSDKQKAALDGVYRRQMSLRTDLKILLLTLRCVLRREGISTPKEADDTAPRS